MIEVRDVSFSHGRTPILSDITLDIPRGGITALVGPNGAGKSTLLGLMARLLPLQSGAISIDGRSLSDTPGREMSRIVSILRQDPNISSRLRVRELVAFGRFPHSRGHLTLDDQARIDEAMERFDLTDFAERFIDTLSGGQRQRAMVAMTYCQGCDTMLLDEPLNNLDMFYAHSLMRTLRDIADRQGKTIVIVLHDINQAAAHADRIVAMRGGKVVVNAPTASALTSDMLETVFGYRMEIASIDGLPVVLHHR